MLSETASHKGEIVLYLDGLPRAVNLRGTESGRWLSEAGR